MVDVHNVLRRVVLILFLLYVILWKDLLLVRNHPLAVALFLATPIAAGQVFIYLYGNTTRVINVSEFNVVDKNIKFDTETIVRQPKVRFIVYPYLRPAALEMLTVKLRLWQAQSNLERQITMKSVETLLSMADLQILNSSLVAFQRERHAQHNIWYIRLPTLKPLPREVMKNHTTKQMKTWRTDIQIRLPHECVEAYSSGMVEPLMEYLTNGIFDIMYQFGNVLYEDIFERLGLVSLKFGKSYGRYMLPFVSHQHNLFYMQIYKVLYIFLGVSFSFWQILIIALHSAEKQQQVAYINSALPAIIYWGRMVLTYVVAVFVNILIVLYYMGTIFPTISSLFFVKLFMLHCASIGAFAYFISIICGSTLQAIGILIAFSVIPNVPMHLSTNQLLVHPAFYRFMCTIFPTWLLSMSCELILISAVEEMDTHLQNLQKIVLINTYSMEEVFEFYKIQAVVYCLAGIILDILKNAHYYVLPIPHYIFGKKMFKKEFRNYAVHVVGVTKTYSSVLVFDDISFDAYPREITGIIGNNGSGKSTLVKMLLAETSPDRGNIYIFGTRVNKLSATYIRNICGVMSDEIETAYHHLTVAQNLFYWSIVRGVSYRTAKTDMAIIAKELELHHHMAMRYSHLPESIQRIAKIAIAFAGRPQLVILENPTCDLDVAWRFKIWSMIKSFKFSYNIIVTSNSISEIETLADHIIILHNNRIAADGNTLMLLKRQLNAGLKVTIIAENHEKLAGIDKHVAKFIPHYFLLVNDLEASFLTSYNYLTHIEALYENIVEFGPELSIAEVSVSECNLSDIYRKLTLPTMMTHLDARSQINHSVITYRSMWNALCMKKKREMSAYWPIILINCIMVVYFIMMSLSQYSKTLAALPPLFTHFRRYRNMIIYYADVKKEKDYNLYRHEMENDFGVFEFWDKNQYPSTNWREVIEKDKLKKYRIMGYMQMERDNENFWFNPFLLHSALFMAGNAIHSLSVDIDFELAYWPFRFIESNTMDYVNEFRNYFAADVAIILTTIMAIYFSNLTIQPNVERSTNLKHYLKLFGLNLRNYWLFQYFWDLFFYLVLVVISVVFIFIYQLKFIGGLPEGPGYLFLILLLFGVTIIPFYYLFCTFPGHPVIWFSIALLYSIFSGPWLSIQADYRIMHEDNYTYVFLDHYLTYTLFCPLFGLYHAVYFTVEESLRQSLCQKTYEYYMKTMYAHIMSTTDLDRVYIQQTMCLRSDFCCDMAPLYFLNHPPGITLILTTFCITGMFSVALLMLLETDAFNNITTKANSYIACPIEDEDVIEEKQRVNGYKPGELRTISSLVLKNLTKIYWRKRVLNGLCLKCNDGECFGILAKNGAGVSVLTDLITRNRYISFGTAYIGSHNIRNSYKVLQQLLGFSPLIKSLPKYLTGRELMEFLLVFRGYTKLTAMKMAHDLFREFLIVRNFDRKLANWSYSDLKRFCTCIPFLDYRPVIVLNSPTAFCDVYMKEMVWNKIRQLRREGATTILLTTHDVEDIENCCDRVAIMADGNFLVMGTHRYLVDKFLQGYYIILYDHIHIDARKVKEFVESNFEDLQFIQENVNAIIYYIECTDLDWLTYYEKLREVESEHDTLRFKFVKTTLEHLYFELALDHPKILKQFERR